MYHDMDGWWWLWGGLMMLLFWGGLIFLVVWAVRSLVNPAERERDDPHEIARRRYASGEISRGEFEQIRSDLSNGPAPRNGPPG